MIEFFIKYDVMLILSVYTTIMFFVSLVYDKKIIAKGLKRNQELEEKIKMLQNIKVENEKVCEEFNVHNKIFTSSDNFNAGQITCVF